MKQYIGLLLILLYVSPVKDNKAEQAIYCEAPTCNVPYIFILCIKQKVKWIILYWNFLILAGKESFECNPDRAGTVARNAAQT